MVGWLFGYLISWFGLVELLWFVGWLVWIVGYLVGSFGLFVGWLVSLVI